MRGKIALPQFCEHIPGLPRRYAVDLVLAAIVGAARAAEEVAGLSHEVLARNQNHGDALQWFFVLVDDFAFDRTVYYDVEIEIGQVVAVQDDMLRHVGGEWPARIARRD